FEHRDPETSPENGDEGLEKAGFSRSRAPDQIEGYRAPLRQEDPVLLGDPVVSRKQVRFQSQETSLLAVSMIAIVPMMVGTMRVGVGVPWLQAATAAGRTRQLTANSLRRSPVPERRPIRARQRGQIGWAPAVLPSHWRTEQPPRMGPSTSSRSA